MKTYCTTFCNRPHRLSDGKPVQHECYILNPKALQLEREGRFEEIGPLKTPVHFDRVMRRGVRS